MFDVSQRRSSGSPTSITAWSSLPLPGGPISPLRAGLFSEFKSPISALVVSFRNSCTDGLAEGRSAYIPIL